MYENIDFDNIDLTQNPPQEEPNRQYYYIAKARQYVQQWLPIVAAAQLTKDNELEKDFLMKWIDVMEYE